MNLQRGRTGTTQDPVAAEHRDRIVTAASTWHGSGAIGLEILENLAPTLQTTDRPGTDSRGIPPSGSTRKVMIKADCSEQFCQRYPERLSHLADDFFRDEPVSIVERVKQWKQWRRFNAPSFHEISIGRRCHSQSAPRVQGQKRPFARATVNRSARNRL